jgi:hypothetical protein
MAANFGSICSTPTPLSCAAFVYQSHYSPPTRCSRTTLRSPYPPHLHGILNSILQLFHPLSQPHHYPRLPIFLWCLILVSRCQFITQITVLPAQALGLFLQGLDISILLSELLLQLANLASTTSVR